MGDMIKKVFIFAAGATIGAAASWKFFETKYKRIADEEIASVKEVYSRSTAEEKPVEPEPEAVPEKTEEEEEAVQLTMYQDMAGLYSGEESEEKGATDMPAKPYVITPDEFGDEPEYDAVSLTLYADGVLTDDYDEIIEDVEGTVGKESFNHFGEYEDDSVFVRNDALQTDYEILKDERDFADIRDDD